MFKDKHNNENKQSWHKKMSEIKTKIQEKVQLKIQEKIDLDKDWELN